MLVTVRPVINSPYAGYSTVNVYNVEIKEKTSTEFDICFRFLLSKQLCYFVEKMLFEVVMWSACFMPSKKSF